MMSSIHFLTGPFVTDSLDDDERTAFQEHLASCADCRAEVAGLRETVALLGGSQASDVSDDLRRRTLSGIAAVRPLPPLDRRLPAVVPGLPAGARPASSGSGRRRL
ncbi:MAG: hypothetical protein JWN22_2702, partial [Nocardioides sp.]|nr:hypothetical protein [Nocardioides sp.]